MNNSKDHKIQTLKVVKNTETQADEVLRGCLGRLKSVFVVGWSDSDKLYTGHTGSEVGDLLLLLELAKEYILDKA